MLPTSKSMNQCTSSLKIHWWRYKFLCCSSMHKVALTWYFSILNPRFGSHMIDIPRTSSSTHREPPDTSMACWGMQLKAWVHRWMPNGEKQIPNNIDECLKDRFETKGTSIMLSEKEMKTTSMKLHRDPKLHRWTFTETQKYIDGPSLKPKSTSMNGIGNPKVHRWKLVRHQNNIDESWFGTQNYIILDPFMIGRNAQ